MVSTSNWPPLVAISVVTRWRRTFSSSVTHFTVTSGFLAVNSLVSPCMRIMSPLFTVAIVSAVSPMEATATNRVNAPSRAPRTCFTVTSLMALNICPHIAITFTPPHASVKARRCGCGLSQASKKFEIPSRSVRPEARALPLRFQDGACGRLVGDQSIDQTAVQRRSDRRHLGRTDDCSDGQGFGRDLRWNAGQASVGPTLDDAALCVERPTGQLADGAQPHHFEQFLARDEAVDVQLRPRGDLPDSHYPQ